jgi:hypothetical protein
VQQKKKQSSAKSQWIPLAAMLWNVNRLKEGDEAWKKAEAWARGLPDSGYAEAERNALRLLRAAMDSSTTAVPAPPAGPTKISV